MTTTTTTVNATATATPINELYRYASRANGSQILCLDLDKLNDTDIELEAEHYEKVLALRVAQGKSPYGALRGTSTGGLVRGDGPATTMFGENLERQARAAGGIAQLLRNWNGGKRSVIARPIVAGVKTAVPARAAEVDPEARLKQIREEEAKLLQLVKEKAERAEAALMSLATEVSEFIDMPVDKLKAVLKETGATDLASGLRAAKAAKAAK